MTRLYLAGGIAVAVLLLVIGIYWKGHSDGKALIQARWNAAEAEMYDRSIEARDEAERAVPPLDDTGPVPTQPCRLPDRYDRDCE